MTSIGEHGAVGDMPEGLHVSVGLLCVHVQVAKPALVEDIWATILFIHIPFTLLCLTAPIAMCSLVGQGDGPPRSF